MQIKHSPLRRIIHTAAIATFTLAATAGLQAQQAGIVDGTNGVSYLSAKPMSSAATLLAANEPAGAIGYSSSAGAVETESAASYMSSSLDADPSPQPPPRRYGRRPVYADSHHNADGSNKYTFFGGGGVSLPTGGTHNYLSTGYNLQVGGGRNFNKKLALLAQFDYNHFGIQSNTLNSLLLEYQGLGATDGNGNELSVLGGNNHIWSLTLDPQYNFLQGDKVGAYVIGGVGYYHKVTTFTVPSTGYYFDQFGDQIPYEANATLETYVSNAPGFDGGFGVTYKASRFSDVKFYAEARYVYTANAQRTFYDGTGTNPSSNPGYFNVFPQNSAKTTYIPIAFGVRF